MSTSLSSPKPRPTLAQVRALARQLSPVSRGKLLAELYAADAAAEVREIEAIGRAVQADGRARGLSPITDADIEREVKEHRAHRAA